MLRTDPTRYLSATTYLRPNFTRTVLDGSLSNPTRLVVPCPELDIAAVNRYCVRAHHRGLALRLLFAGRRVISAPTR